MEEKKSKGMGGGRVKRLGWEIEGVVVVAPFNGVFFGVFWGFFT